MIFASILFAAVSVLPSDRMAMADRMFDRGDYAAAAKEYAAVAGAEGIKEDELLYRLAECDRALGDKKSARERYGTLVGKYPLSRHAARSRLMRALTVEGEERVRELKLLDSDSVPAATRAAALYHIGEATGDAEFFSRCMAVDPGGKYAEFAKFRHAAVLSASDDPAKRRTAVKELYELHFKAKGDLAKDALFLAARRSRADGKNGEASSLFRRYMKLYPDDSRAAEARILAAWSDYGAGRYADAASLCGDGGTDDAAYLLAACAYATGDYAKAAKAMAAYLADFPQGKYRKAVELPLARMEFKEADAADDFAKSVEAAKRSAALSGGSQDRMRLAWAYEKGGKLDEAMAEYAAIAKDFPGTDDAAEALFRRAMRELRENRWNAADILLAEVIASRKNTRRKAESLYWRGYCAMKLGHREEGTELLSAALEEGLSLDQAREARLVLADADYSAGRVAEAKAAYAKLVREGACERMSAAKLRNTGRFLLECDKCESAVEEAKKCAAALVDAGGTPEWRQAGFALAGAAAEADGEYTAAIDFYRKAMAEKAKTADLGDAALHLGILESRSGEHAEADATLRSAVSLNRDDAAKRVSAYLWLARNCESMTDYRGACAYATVIVSLFGECPETAEAAKILENHPEAAQ